MNDYELARRDRRRLNSATKSLFPPLIPYNTTAADAVMWCHDAAGSHPMAMRATTRPVATMMGEMPATAAHLRAKGVSGYSASIYCSSKWYSMDVATGSHAM